MSKVLAHTPNVSVPIHVPRELLDNFTCGGVEFSFQKKIIIHFNDNS